MCVIYVAYQQHPTYPLILLANRDEFYDRPTSPAHRWADHDHITAGRDLVAGGTWLGITDSGKFAAVTNYRDPNAPQGKLSRGSLVAEFLKTESSPGKYMEAVKLDSSSYSGFNLLVGEINAARSEIYYFSNRGAGIQQLTSGIYGLSNHLLNTPWPKVARGMEKFEQLIVNGMYSTEASFDLLADETIATEETLPNTGIGLQSERILSPIFIKTSNYGTRSSTVVTIDNKFKAHLIERVFA